MYAADTLGCTLLLGAQQLLQSISSLSIATVVVHELISTSTIMIEGTLQRSSLNYIPEDGHD
jgi:hypothetical protein